MHFLECKLFRWCNFKRNKRQPSIFLFLSSLSSTIFSPSNTFLYGIPCWSHFLIFPFFYVLAHCELKILELFVGGASSHPFKLNPLVCQQLGLIFVWEVSLSSSLSVGQMISIFSKHSNNVEPNAHHILLKHFGLKLCGATNPIVFWIRPLRVPISVLCRRAHIVQKQLPKTMCSKRSAKSYS